MSELKSTGQRSIISNRFKARFSGSHPDLKVAANALKLSLEVTEKVLDAMPVYGPKAVIGTVLKIIERCEKCTDNTEVLQDVKSRLDRLRTAVVDPLAHPNAVISPELKAAVDTFVRCLDLITYGWDAKLSQNFLIRFLNAEEYEAGLVELSHGIDGAVSCFQAASAVRQERKIDEIQDLILSNTKDANERDERLHKSMNQVGRIVRAAAGENLDPIEAMPYAMQAHYKSLAHSEIRTCLPGTRVAVLAKIRSFIMNAQENQRKNYLLSGMAGLGKSTIARSICAEIDRQQDADLAASFFFSRRAADSDLRNPEIIIPTIAYQLARFDEGFRAALKEELTNDPLLTTTAIQFQAEGLLAKSLSRMSPRQHPVLIVLDAFDECDRESIAAEVLHWLLLSVAAAPCNIKLLITSRPEAHIRVVFRKSDTHGYLILHEIEEDIVKGDIRLYLQTSLRAIPSNLGLNLPDDWATQEETEALVEMTGKLFIHAATAVRLLGDSKFCNPRSRLQMLLKPSVATASDMHTHLDETYKAILQAALPPQPAQALVGGRIRQVLGTIVHLQDALTVGAIDGLLMEDSGYCRGALNSLHSVVLVPESDSGFPRLYHQSFPDFLLDPQRCSDIRFLIKPEDHHTNISRHCLNLLNRYLRRDILGIEDLLLPHSEIEEFDRKVALAVPPQLAYGCRSWAKHIAHSRRGDPDLMQSLLNFVFKNILHWVECMSLLGSIELAIRSIQTAIQWAEESKAPAGAIAMLHDATRFLQAHSEPIRSCAVQVYRTALIFTPSETILFTNFRHEAGESRVIQGGAQTWPDCLAVWNIPGVHCIAFSPDGTRVAVAAGSDGSIHIRDSFTGETISVLRGHSQSVSAVAFSPDGIRITSGSYDETVRVWDAQLVKQLVILHGHSDPVRSVAFSPNGTRIASGSDDNTVQVWDAHSGEQLAILRGHSDWVRSVTFSPDGHRIASGSDDNTVRVWDAQSSKQVAVIRGHSQEILSVAFSLDGSRIASASCDNTVRVWGAQSGKQLAILRGHSNHAIGSTAFSPDGTRIAFASSPILSAFETAKDIVQVWDAQSSKQLAILRGHSGDVNSVAFSPDGTRIASGSSDNTVRVWAAQSFKKSVILRDHSCTVQSKAFSLDGTRIAFASQTYYNTFKGYDHTLQVWDAHSGEQLAILRGHSNLVLSVAFSPDGTRIAFGPNDNTIRVWDAQSFKELAILRGHTGCVVSIAFSPDGTRIASGSDDNTLRVWDVQSSKELVVLPDRFQHFVSMAFSQDGASIIVHDLEGQRLFNSSTGILLSATGSSPSATLADTLSFYPSTRWIVEQSSRKHILFIPRSYEITYDKVSLFPNGGLVAFGTTDGLVVIIKF